MNIYTELVSTPVVLQTYPRALLRRPGGGRLEYARRLVGQRAGEGEGRRRHTRADAGGGQGVFQELAHPHARRGIARGHEGQG